ncbi:MAG: RnfABCDGE type electron transport complex subunit D [Pseudomonadota bacterium]
MGVRNQVAAAFGAVNRDARHWQIMALSGLFSISFLTSDFGARPLNLAMAVSGAIVAQLAGTIFTNLRSSPRRRGPQTDTDQDLQNQIPAYAGMSGLLHGFQWKSALITSLSLSILLRATSPWLWFAAGLIGVGLKFAVRVNNKHIFNPACIGIVAVMLLFGREAWVSPGQWGQAPLLAGYAIALAALVLSSAKRLDIAFGFLGTFAAILFTRAAWLGDPFTIPMHQLSSGALLVFAFFMITDPRSTPDSRAGRVLFAMTVAGLAAWFMIGPNVRGAPLMALAALAFLTPLIDRVLPARRFEWTSQEDPTHGPETASIRVRARPRFLRA